MAGSTTKYALPYPSGTDPLKQGDDTIKALAERVEVVMSTLNTPVVLTPINGWSVYGGFAPPRAIRDPNGLVVLWGLVAAVVAAPMTPVILSLPSNMRPVGGTVLFHVESSYAVGGVRIDVDSNGSVIANIPAATSVGHLSLGGIVFQSNV